ncbi:helix-turn-helix domain-containing protein, partial [Streptomyces bobili]|uniref:helix-turn-helix domain-containing protein n=1 Tax=Streptomyces bobili TaxID=67280 RepID=UPI003CC647CF
MPARTTPTAPDSQVPEEAVTPLIRGVAVLEELTAAGGTMSASALERATGLARSTVDRIVATLARMEYVRLDGRDAVLTPHVMELGNAYLAALRLPALLGRRADALADELDESVSLTVADRDGIRFIHQATRRRAMSLSFRIGDLLPAERTAPGPLFATQWTDADWTHWRARRATDPQDRTFPAVPPAPEVRPDADFVRRTGGGGLCLAQVLLHLRDGRTQPGEEGVAQVGRRVAARVADHAGDAREASRTRVPYGRGDRHQARLDQLVVQGPAVRRRPLGPAYEVGVRARGGPRACGQQGRHRVPAVEHLGGQAGVGE